jgi:hypothetical protein
MKVTATFLLVTSAAAFTPATFGIRGTSGLSWSREDNIFCQFSIAYNAVFFYIVCVASVLLAEYDLNYGKKNSYVPASAGDGGQGQFGACSPNDWRVPGTSPIGQSSWSGAADGGDEPWFAEAVSTVSLDLKKAEETLKAFTKDAASFKINAFAKENGIKNAEKAFDELVGSMGYDKFLEASPNQLKKAFESLNPPKGD